MKRSLLIAALSTVAAGSALAQSSVTIYGRLNETVERQKDGDTSNTKVVDSSSRIGFKGVEDLGGGLKAGFLIEHGFAADTGTAGAAFWGRESNVFLSHDSIGTLRLGNMGPTAAYFATADYISMHNHDTGTSSDAFYLYTGDVRNTIAYKTPTFGGLQAEVQLGLREGGPKNTGVLAVNYDMGGLHLGAGYVQGPVTIDAVTFTDAKEIGLRGLYEFGAFTAGAYYIRNQGELGANEFKRDSFRLSGMFTTGAVELHANLGLAGKIKVNGTSADGTDAKQFTLGANYNLSKRTKVYGFYTKVDNKANIGYYSSADGNDFQSLALGVRHNF
ncbi:MAG: porin [Cytophagales bacterium]|nr:porin [Rhizobacter sp.]